MLDYFKELFWIPWGLQGSRQELLMHNHSTQKRQEPKNISCHSMNKIKAVFDSSPTQTYAYPESIYYVIQWPRDLSEEWQIFEGKLKEEEIKTPSAFIPHDTEKFKGLYELSPLQVLRVQKVK